MMTIIGIGRILMEHGLINRVQQRLLQGLKILKKMREKGVIHMTWDFIISAKNRYLKGKNIKILLLSLLLILLFMLIFIYKKNDMYEIDAATKYKFESLMGKSEYEITLVLGKEDKYEGSGYPHPVYILDNGIEVKLIFVHAYDLEYGSKLWRIVYKKDGKIIRDVRTKLNN